MATFKVGQRVKRVAHNALHDGPRLGEEGIVLRLEPTNLAQDGSGSCLRVEFPSCGDWGCWPSTLAPLTDPRESAWASEKVANLFKPKSLPLHPSELETVRGGA